MISESIHQQTDLITHDLKLENLEKVFELMARSNSRIPVKDKKSVFVVYKNCFTGNYFIFCFKDFVMIIL